jgi:Family of unknown function (DUF6286)
LLVALAVAGLAVALFSLGSGTGDFSLPGLARLIGLPELREEVGTLLARLEASGPTASVAAACGLGAMVLGVCLLVGALWPRRERLVLFEQDERGTVAARRRVLASVAGALAEQPRGVTEAKVRVRPGRRRGGRLSVRAYHSRLHKADEVRRREQAALAPLTEELGLQTRVRARLGGRGRRVE